MAAIYACKDVADAEQWLERLRGHALAIKTALGGKTEVLGETQRSSWSRAVSCDILIPRVSAVNEIHLVSTIKVQERACNGRRSEDHVCGEVVRPIAVTERHNGLRRAA